ncbi:hypothetical protein Slin14017_G111700 [Septoria linicola]|nr:hypothetical protein Slin14017_G111700 [Septoria linicola]
MNAIEVTATESKRCACERLFGVFELAEAVFLELPPQQVLINVQRVNRAWQEVVNTSMPLQQALFFRPITSEPLQFVQSFGENRGGSWRFRCEGDQAATVYEHPLLGQLVMDQLQPSSAVVRPEASWRKQLLTQPPVSFVTLITGDVRAAVKAKEVGVTMGSVHALVELIPTSSTAISDWSRWQSYLHQWRQYPAARALEMLKTN